MTRRGWALGFLVLLVLAISFSRVSPPQARTPGRRIFSAAAKELPGLLFRLSPERPEGSADETSPQAHPTPLDGAHLQALLRRLPPLKTQAGDRRHFALREQSLPAPRTAKSVSVPFPPKETRKAPEVAKPALAVTRFAPKGPIEMAPHLTVSFNQPMVPMSTLAQLEQRDLPVRLSPQPPGKWRWLGTDTLMFVPTLRFPMATEYK